MRNARLAFLLTLCVLAASCVDSSKEQASAVAASGETAAGSQDTTAASSTTSVTTGVVSGEGSATAALTTGAPQHVVATQGPIDEEANYVLVTWDHGLSDATGYEVQRNGASIATVPVDETPWNDMALRDDRVPAGDHTYRVRGLIGEQAGAWSEPAAITVMGSADVGPVFDVASFSGADRARIQAAIDAASDAGGGIVQLEATTYLLDDPLVVYGNGVLLRGAGQDQTTLKVAVPGGDESCGRVTPTLLFQSQLEPVGATLVEPAERGDSVLTFSTSPSVQVGDVIAIDGVIGQLPTWAYVEEGIAQDPTIPLDERYPFEAGTVVAAEGNQIELDHPLSQRITKGSELYRYEGGHDNGIELLTVEGLSAEDLTYHRLIDVRDQVRFRVADVTARWANRNFIDASGHHITVIGFEGVDGGAGGYELEACKYKAGFGPATDVTIVASSFGSTEHDRNMSLVTMQFVYRAVIRHSTFGGSRTYGFNEHGGGSRDLVFENNWVASGPDSWAGILSGNDTWGFGGELAIRNNRFVDNVSDVYLVEHAYGVSIVGNHSTGCSDVCIVWSGWGGEHDGHRVIEDESNWGAARLLIASNRIEGAADGILLGGDDSSGFPYPGVRDVVMTDNRIQSDGIALRIEGSAEESGRLWVANNSFEGSVETEDPGPDWWFWGNSVGPTTAPGDLPDWADAYQEWER